MRAFLLLALLLAPSVATAQVFTPPSESENVSNYGVHVDALQVYPGDRWSAFVYDEKGAFVANLETLTVPIIYGLVDAALGGDALDPDAQDNSDAGSGGSPSDARFAPGFINMWFGKTFVTTPFGELGVGLDAGFVLLQATPNFKASGDDLEFVAQAGPNLLFTSRPLDNLHTVVHASYQFLALSEAMESGRTVLDIQAYYRLKRWLGLYGGVHWSTWKAQDTLVSGRTPPTDTYTGTGLTFGVAFIPMWQQF